MMNDCRNETSPFVEANKINDAREEAQSYTNPYESMNESKAKTINENGFSMDSNTFGSRVRDRKKFFERHISEQHKKENALVSPMVSKTKLPATDQTNPEDEDRPLINEERSESTSLIDSKSAMLEFERRDCESLLHEKREEIDHKRSSETSKPGSDTNPSKTSEIKPPHYSSKENGVSTRNDFRTLKLRSTGLAVGRTNSSRYVEKVESLDNKVLSSPNLDSPEFKEKKEQKSVEESRLTSTGRTLEQSKNDVRQEHVESNGTTTSMQMGETNDEQVVQIKATRKSATDQKPPKSGENDETSTQIHEGNVDIDEMITEFQQASAKLSSSKNLFAAPHLHDQPNTAENNKDNSISQDKIKNESNSGQSIAAPNSLTVDDYNVLAENLHRSRSEPIKNNLYICPSESDDDSIDSTGKLKMTKSVSSKSVKSPTKVKSGGMGMMLKKAKKGMGKSVRNLKDIMKNTIKTKSPRQSIIKVIDGSSHQQNCVVSDDLFDVKLAEQIVNESKGKTEMLKANQYLNTGKKLLLDGAELKKTNDSRGSKEMIRQAHTYVYVARQLAEQYLLKYRQEISDEVDRKQENNAPLSNDDNIAAFEDFLLSFLQCVGACAGGDSLENSKLQVDEALRILNKISEEEDSIFENRVSKEIHHENGVDHKAKVKEAIANDFVSAGRNDVRRIEYVDYYENLAIDRFLSDLRSFYKIDTTLIFSQDVWNGVEEHEDDDSDTSLESDINSCPSISYNYSEPLKFDHGSSYRTRSVSTAGSMKHEQPSSSSVTSRVRKPKEESLVEGIRPGKTVVSISMKDKHNKQRNNNDTKKKQPTPKKWRQRKQKNSSHA